VSREEITMKRISVEYKTGEGRYTSEVVDYMAATELMDDDIRERLHRQLSPCTPQEFFTAYEAVHEAAYGEEWELSKKNPTW
jgi:hypothetical protein